MNLVLFYDLIEINNFKDEVNKNDVYNRHMRHQIPFELINDIKVLMDYLFIIIKKYLINIEIEYPANMG